MYTKRFPCNYLPNQYFWFSLGFKSLLLGRQQHLVSVFLTKSWTNPDSPLCCLLSLLCYVINNSLSSSAPHGLGHFVATTDERQELRDRLLAYKRLTLVSADWISFAGASLLLIEILDYLLQHTENRADSYNFLLPRFRRTLLSVWLLNF